MTPKPSSNPSFIPDEGPYRTDPARVANEAFQVATEVRDLVKTDLKQVNSRLAKLEHSVARDYGFFRTNWNSFWSFVSNIVQKILSIEFFFIAVAVTAVSLIVWALWSSGVETDRVARDACQRANMTVIYSSNNRTSCIRADGAVLTISGENTPVLTVPNQ